MNVDNDLIVPENERDFYVRLGAALRKVRGKRGISIEALAAVANITPERLTQYEDAQLAMPVYHLIPIMQYLDFPPELEARNFRN